MNKHILPSVLLLAACSPGPSDDTLVDELRVIAAVVEPPEAQPGESVSVDVVIADPTDLGAEVAVWLCTPTGTGCAEEGLPLDQRLAVGSLDDGRFEAGLTVDALWAGFASSEPLPSSVWVLACEPGLCPVIGQLEASLGASPTQEVETLLATPTEWVADLPLLGVSLAAKQLAVSTREPGERNENPTLEVQADLVSEPGAEQTLDVVVSDDGDVAEVMGLSTGGGFGLTAFAFFEGRATMRWYAPEEASTVKLYAVATDGMGGTAVWSGEAEVR